MMRRRPASGLRTRDISQDEVVAAVQAGAIWTDSVGNCILCEREEAGVWRPVADVTTACDAAEAAGRIHFAGLVHLVGPRDGGDGR